jgi:hypothetical protein
MWTLTKIKGNNDFSGNADYGFAGRVGNAGGIDFMGTLVRGAVDATTANSSLSNKW